MKINVKTIIILVGLVVASVLVWQMYLNYQTRSYSPLDSVTYTKDSLEIRIDYCRPYKKGREIFGGLVPYDQPWRTGANDATTFSTNQDVNINGEILKKGTYSLWTIPNKEEWTVIFNSEYAVWGINSEGIANFNPSKNILETKVKPYSFTKTYEQFEILFEEHKDESTIVLIWDTTVIVIPFEPIG